METVIRVANLLLFSSSLTIAVCTGIAVLGPVYLLMCWFLRRLLANVSTWKEIRQEKEKTTALDFVRWVKHDRTLALCMAGAIVGFAILICGYEITNHVRWGR
jgi:hypothetical protein